MKLKVFERLCVIVIYDDFQFKYGVREFCWSYGIFRGTFTFVAMVHGGFLLQDLCRDIHNTTKFFSFIVFLFEIRSTIPRLKYSSRFLRWLSTNRTVPMLELIPESVGALGATATMSARPIQMVCCCCEAHLTQVYKRNCNKGYTKFNTTFNLEIVIMTLMFQSMKKN